MPDLAYIRAEIEHMRLQVGRQRKDILAFKEPASVRPRLSFFWEGCWPRLMTCVRSGADFASWSP